MLKVAPVTAVLVLRWTASAAMAAGPTTRRIGSVVRCCSRAFRAFARDVGGPAHPHLLRHSLASAMAAAKEPASVIAGQLRHADGGTLASRTYIHQRLRPTPSGQAD